MVFIKFCYTHTTTTVLSPCSLPPPPLPATQYLVFTHTPAPLHLGQHRGSHYRAGLVLPPSPTTHTLTPATATDSFYLKSRSVIPCVSACFQVSISFTNYSVLYHTAASFSAHIQFMNMGLEDGSFYHRRCAPLPAGYCLLPNSSTIMPPFHLPAACVTPYYLHACCSTHHARTFRFLGLPALPYFASRQPGFK